jgi:hypothetical protein
MLLEALAAVLLASAPQDPRPRTDCRESQECRTLALAARERRDFEAFHDLAWRAVQTGPKNDRALMYLLARAQSASGRPLDAIVMLARLVDAGVAVDAIAEDDFEYVRQLPTWPALRERIESMPAAAAAPATTAPTTTTATPSAAPGSAKPGPAPSPAAAAAPESARAAGGGRPADSSDAMSFSTPGATPVGIAYDAVSRRFVVADRATRKLSVVDEFSRHVATLAGAQASFAEISALEIDPRAGNLWVVSSETGGTPTTTLHKLQLISGRVLSAFPLPASFGAARFADVAVTAQGVVLALDDERGRVFRLRGASFDVVATLSARPSTLAPTDGGAAYVADSEGLVRVDLGSGATVRVTPPNGRTLSNISRLRWHRGSLVGLQREGNELKAVRLTLDRSGRSVRAVQSIDPSWSAADPTAAAIAGDALYYLATANAGEATVRKVRLN